MTDNELQISAIIKKLVYGNSVECAGDTRVVITGNADLQQRQKLQRSAQSLATHRQERLEADTMKLVLKPLSKACKEQEQGDRMRAMLPAAGLSGVQSASFSPDTYPKNPRSGVVGFVGFAEQEQRDAAITDHKASYALMGSEFQIGTWIVRCEQKDPERNLALDRLEKDTMAHATGKETAEHQIARRKVQRQGTRQGGGMTIADEEGTVLKRSGEAALQQVQEQANRDLTAALAVKVNQLLASFD